MSFMCSLREILGKLAWDKLAIGIFGIIFYISVAPAFASDPVLTTLASFDASNGANPSVTLVQDSEGNLYGTTEYGGTPGNEQGALFEYNKSTQQLSSLLNFGVTNGSNPIAQLLSDGNGNFYGTTRAGGYGSGTLFEFSSSTQILTTLYNFSGSNGGLPYAGVITISGGSLYGTTYEGGAKSMGTVFRFDLSTHTITSLVSFNGTNGSNPYGGLIFDSIGNLYGTTQSGGEYGMGTVFCIAAGTQTLTTLASFDGSNGKGPDDSLKLGSDGNLYGTTVFGGANGFGSVFEISPVTKTITTLDSFNETNGAYPIGGLISDAAGNLYGTTQLGGPSNDGTVFKISSSDDTLTALVSFDNTDGWAPDGSLIADSAGNLYGTTYYGGANHNASFFGVFGDGTLFEVSDSGFVVPEPESPAICIMGLFCIRMIGYWRERVLNC